MAYEDKNDIKEHTENLTPCLIRLFNMKALRYGGLSGGRNESLLACGTVRVSACIAIISEAVRRFEGNARVG